MKTHSIESKSVLFSLLRDAENHGLATHTLDTEWGRRVGANVTLMELSAGDYAVCDKSTEGDYLTYLFDKEADAEVCYQTILAFLQEAEAIEKEREDA